MKIRHVSSLPTGQVGIRPLKNKLFTNEIIYQPIGIVHSPFTQPEGTPIQSIASTTGATIEVFPEYAEGLIDLDQFSHISMFLKLRKTDGSTKR
jgi:tRNA (Thr-GGU) A37 N-methylase